MTAALLVGFACLFAQDSAGASYGDFLWSDTLSRGEAPPSGIPGSVALSGYLETGFDSHRYPAHPAWMDAEAAGSAWDARLGLKISATASALARAWSTVTFARAFTGGFLNGRAASTPHRVDIPGVGEGSDTLSMDAARHPGGEGEGSPPVEDLLAGIDFTSDRARASLRAGTTLWVQGSPLTVWRREPRPGGFAEDFFPRDRPQGRRALAGLETSALLMLPRGGSFSLAEIQLDALQPGAIFPSSRGGTPARAGEAAVPWDGGSPGGLYYGRLRLQADKQERSLSLNGLVADLSPEIINQNLFSQGAPRGWIYQFKDRRPPAFTNPRVLTLAGSAALGPALLLEGEAGLSVDDSVVFLPVTGTDSLYDGRSSFRHRRGPPAPAAWARLSGKKGAPYACELFFASPAFRSPYSMAESGLPIHREGMSLGAGSFAYQPNLAGFLLSASAPLAKGYLSASLGQHIQISPDPDLLRFPVLLNGYDAWNAGASAARADAARMLEDGLPLGAAKPLSRLGDLGPGRDLRYGGQQPGGLRGGDGEIQEEFAAYLDKAQADSGRVPRSRKLAASLSLDAGYPVNTWFGAWRPMIIGLHGEANAVGTTLASLADGRAALLWSGLLEIRPSFALGPGFTLLVTAGVEWIHSRYAWRNLWDDPETAGGPVRAGNYDPLSSLTAQAQGAVPRVDAVTAPIRYLRSGYGLGIKWDFAARASLALRANYGVHRDAYLPANNWSGVFFHAGILAWI
jgi:hypothetical protein